MVEIKKVLLEKVDTLENIANSLTKSMSVMKFSLCREAMGIVDPVNEQMFIFSCINKEDNKWENVGLLYSLQ
jgi:hypothetical protein